MTRTTSADPSVKRVVVGIVVTVVITAACLVVAAVLSRQALNEAGSSPSEEGAVFVHPIRDNDAGVRQRPILSDHPAYMRQRAQRERLESLGWVDKAQGRAHIPIDAAMDLVSTLR